MAASETIHQKDTLPLWKALIQDNAPITLRPLDQSHAWTATASDVRTRKRKLYLVIENLPPLRSTLVDTPDSRLGLEFTDRNNVPHRCEVDGFRLNRKDIWLQIPATIERYQRRKIFRLEAPSGSELSLNIKGIDCSLLLIDVSISGALGLMTHLSSKPDSPILGRQGQTIADAVLIFPTHSGPERILISECTIRRLETHAVTGKMQYALEFTAIDECNEELLTKMIYKFQREYLRRRRKTR